MNSRLIFCFGSIFFKENIFWNQPSDSGEPHIDEARFFISFDITFVSSRIDIGVFVLRASAIFL